MNILQGGLPKYRPQQHNNTLTRDGVKINRIVRWSPMTSSSVFKLNTTFVGYFDQKKFIFSLMMKINNIQGALTDVSAKTEYGP